MLKRPFRLLFIVCCAVSLSGAAGNEVTTDTISTGGGQMKLTSSAFREGEMIPREYTCDSSDISPPLQWSGMPEGTSAFALIADDPDAPAGTWVHWVVYNIPSSATSLSENVPKIGTLPDGSRQGVNSSGKTGYGGPCPPSGTHRYYFKLYALDSMLTAEKKMDKTALLKAMDGHIKAQGQLMGRYKH